MKNLREAGLRVGMITGDNIDTAIAVAYSSGIIRRESEIAEVYKFIPLTGGLGVDYLEAPADLESPRTKTSDVERDRLESDIFSVSDKVGVLGSDDFAQFTKYHNLTRLQPVDLSIAAIELIATRIGVFSRMTPEQKALIVHIQKCYWKQFKNTVGYCGDGANDTIALKEADMGVVLSKVAGAISAPFVSYKNEITCVQDIALEGKAALTTNFDCFRYFCTYSVIQTIGMLVTVSQRTEYADMTYLLLDIFIALMLSYCIGWLQPVKTLNAWLPSCTLLFREYILSIMLNCFYCSVAVYAALEIVFKDPAYKPPIELIGDEKFVDNNTPTFETTVISLVAIQGSIITAVSLTLGNKFKRSFYSSVLFICCFTVLELFTLWLLFYRYLPGSTFATSKVLPSLNVILVYFSS